MDDQSDGLRVEAPRRLEILTGGSGRRRWSEALKAQIVSESLAPNVIVADVARRYGARPGQLFGWRRDAREGKLALPAEAAPRTTNFAPVVISEKSLPVARRQMSSGTGAIEIEAPGVAVRIHGPAEVALVEAIVRALRASA
jgi:transposase